MFTFLNFNLITQQRKKNSLLVTIFIVRNTFRNSRKKKLLLCKCLRIVREKIKIKKTVASFCFCNPVVELASIGSGLHVVLNRSIFYKG